MKIEESIPLLEEILDKWRTELGNDYLGYKNHVYRMIRFCFALHDCDDEEGLPKTYIKSVKDRFPNAGFHKRLTQLAVGWFSKHPLSPPPFLRW